MSNARMLSIPSSRYLIPWVLCVTFIFGLLRLLSTPWLKYHVDLDELLFSYLPSGIPVQFSSRQPDLHDDFLDVFALNAKPILNSHIGPLLRCSSSPNNITNAVRFPNAIKNISFAPRDALHDPANRYFNPTVIPLPPYSPYPYLLLSRLVTEGLHQESHICLATLCSLRNNTKRQVSSTDSRWCDTSDTLVLGLEGGIRCATTPEKLNIPPTPAYRCEGVWSAFPDIPGFHDPRVFWSGKDEPLVIVNSGSQYACVGLWIVDLRAVYPELNDLLGRKGKYNALGGRREDGMEISARVSYPHLTELTRNPRQSRSSVEKNWILFFPHGEESWVQYDLVAHDGQKSKSTDDEHHNKNSLLATLSEGVGVAVNASTNGITKLENNSTKIAHKSATSWFNQSLEVSHGSKYQENTLVQIASEHTTSLKLVKRSRINASHTGRKLIPSRSLAKLIGSGYTTPNLTSPYETPCLASDNLLDSYGNKGRWHQGSNSLRLILCSRNDIICLDHHEERRLVETGKVVHFAILHRKFSNNYKLPMRYERYLMVWEARFPFRLVGISRHPILFAGEKAQPWTDVENELKDDQEAKRWKDVYFTYTPSLAWSWRKESIRINDGVVKTDLGTGYLNDDVIVGIGMDDVAQGFVRVKAEDLLGCLRLCPDFETPGRI